MEVFQEFLERIKSRLKVTGNEGTKNFALFRTSLALKKGTFYKEEEVESITTQVVYTQNVW